MVAVTIPMTKVRAWLDERGVTFGDVVYHTHCEWQSARGNHIQSPSIPSEQKNVWGEHVRSTSFEQLMDLVLEEPGLKVHVLDNQSRTSTHRWVLARNLRLKVWDPEKVKPRQEVA